jgi:thiosulfate/3-mercaptopyruvate sulfurtransferase
MHSTKTTLISTDELAARLDDPTLLLIDVRHDLLRPERWGVDEYNKAHIPGAVFLHLDNDLSAPKTGVNGRHPLPTPEACAALFGRAGIDATKQVVAYDQNNGVFASRLWWMLRWLGHEAAAVLDGGFAKWTREGRAVSAEAVAPHAAKFTVTRVAPTVNSVGVESSLSRHTLLLVDARAPERFRGEVEPMDPVAGHIPARSIVLLPRTSLRMTGSSPHPRLRQSSRRSRRAGTPEASSIIAGRGSPRVTRCWRWSAPGSPGPSSMSGRGASGAASPAARASR